MNNNLYKGLFILSPKKMVDSKTKVNVEEQIEYSGPFTIEQALGAVDIVYMGEVQTESRLSKVRHYFGTKTYLFFRNLRTGHIIDANFADVDSLVQKFEENREKALAGENSGESNFPMPESVANSFLKKQQLEHPTSWYKRTSEGKPDLDEMLQLEEFEEYDKSIPLIYFEAIQGKARHASEKQQKIREEAEKHPGLGNWKKWVKEQLRKRDVWIEIQRPIIPSGEQEESDSEIRLNYDPIKLILRVHHEDNTTLAYEALEKLKHYFIA